MDRAWQAIVHKVTRESDITEQLNNSHLLGSISPGSQSPASPALVSLAVALHQSPCQGENKPNGETVEICQVSSRFGFEAWLY